MTKTESDGIVSRSDAANDYSLYVRVDGEWLTHAAAMDLGCRIIALATMLRNEERLDAN